MSFSPNVLLIPNFVKNKFHSVTLFSFSQYSSEIKISPSKQGSMSTSGLYFEPKYKLEANSNLPCFVKNFNLER